MSLWRKIIAVKLPPFRSWSEKCHNLGNFTLSRWIFKNPCFKSFGKKNLLKCLKNALLKMSVNFRLDFIGVLFSFLGAHAIELNIYMSHYHRLFTPSKRHKEISFCSGSAGNIREDHNSLSWWRKKVIKEKNTSHLWCQSPL